MTLAKQIRQRLGIAQPAFADLLNCTEGHLAMHETGRRVLPEKSRALLYKLEAALAKCTEQQMPTQFNASAANKRALRHAQLRLEKTKDKLALLTQKMEQCNLLLQLEALWMTADDLLPESNNIARMKILAREAKKKFGIYQQRWLQTQIALAGLQAQIQRATE